MFFCFLKATKKNKKQNNQRLQCLPPKQHQTQHIKMSQFKSAVQEFIDGEDNSMGFVLKSIQQNNRIVIGDEEDDLFTIVVLDASNGKFVRGGARIIFHWNWTNH